jgi:hypothetical protein
MTRARSLAADETRSLPGLSYTDSSEEGYAKTKLIEAQEPRGFTPLLGGSMR